MNPLARSIIVPALPAALAIIGVVMGGIAGLFEPAFGFGWGASSVQSPARYSENSWRTS
jgi:hypothetical protein